MPSTSVWTAPDIVDDRVAIDDMLQYFLWLCRIDENLDFESHKEQLLKSCRDAVGSFSDDERLIEALTD